MSHTQFKIMGKAIWGRNLLKKKKTWGVWQAANQKMYLILIWFLCFKQSNFSPFINQAHHSVAIENRVSLTLTELFRQDFSLSSSSGTWYQTSLVQKRREIVFKKWHLGEASFEFVIQSKAPVNQNFWPSFNGEYVPNCKDQEFSVRLHIWMFA